MPLLLTILLTFYSYLNNEDYQQKLVVWCFKIKRTPILGVLCRAGKTSLKNIICRTCDKSHL